MKGEELARIRLRLKLSQAQFAAKLGLHKNTVNRYERGHRRIPQVVEMAARGLDKGK